MIPLSTCWATEARLTGLGSHEWWGVHLTLWLKERLLTPLLGFLPAPFPRAQTKLTSAFSGTQPVSLSFTAVRFTYRPPERRQVLVTDRPVPGQLNHMLLLLPEADWQKMMNRIYLQIVFFILTIFFLNLVLSKWYLPINISTNSPTTFCIWSIIACITYTIAAVVI